MAVDMTTTTGSTTGTSGSSSDSTGSTGSTGTDTGGEVFGDGASDAASGASGTSEIPADDGSWDDIANIFGDDTDMPADDVDTGSSLPETPEEDPVEETRANRTTTDSPNRLASLINKPLSLPRATDFFNDLFDKVQEAFDKLKEKGKETKEDAKKTLKESLNNANILKGKLLGELDKALKEGKGSVVEAYQEMLEQIEDMRASILENMRLDLGDGAKKAFIQAKEVAKNLGTLLNGEKNAKGETLLGQPKPANPDGTKLGYKSPGSKVANSMPQPDLSPEEMVRKLAEETKTKEGIEGIKDPKNPEAIKKAADKVAQLLGSKEAKEREDKKNKFNDLRSKLGSITQGIINHAKSAQGAASDMLKGVVLSLQTQAFNGVMSGMVSGGMQVFGHASQGLEEEDEAYALLAQLGVINPKNQSGKAQKAEASLPSNPDEWDGVNATMNNKYRIAWNARDFLPDFEKPLEGDDFATVGQEAMVKDLESMPV